MVLLSSMRPYKVTIDGLSHRVVMPESSALARIAAYVAKNKIMASIEADYQELLAIKATKIEVIHTNKFGQEDQETTSKSRELDYIHDDEPLVFENDPTILT